MKKKLVLWLAALTFLVAGQLAFHYRTALAAYGAVILNDGTYVWSWNSNGTGNGQIVMAQGAAAAAFTVDQLGGPMLPFSITSALPTCGSALKGAMRVVTDATTPTYNGTLVGSGAVVVPVECNGAAWVTH